MGPKNLGGILIRQGRLAEARPHLEAALKASPQDAHAWFLFGEAAVQSDDHSTARAAYHQARRRDPDGPIGERAEQALNRLAGDPLPRNADGVTPAALAAMIAALRRLRSLPPQAAKELTLKAALIGQHGLRLTDPAKSHHIEGIVEPLSGLEVVCLLHAGVQLASPGATTGLALDPEFMGAKELIEEFKRSVESSPPHRIHGEKRFRVHRSDNKPPDQLLNCTRSGSGPLKLP